MALSRTSRARWIIRLSLGGLLLVLILAVGFAWPRSSRVSIEEAKKAYETLEHGMTRAHVESLFGPPTDVQTLEGGNVKLHWEVTNETFTVSAVAHIEVYFDAEAKLTERYYMRFTARGWDAWTWRWARLWARVGGNHERIQ